MAKPVTSLIGRQFGQLRVLSFAGRLNGKPYWNCLCACGAMKIVMGQSLRQGKTTACGCVQRAYAARPKKLVPGLRFGRLVTLRLVPGKASWDCRCDCGQETVARSSSLLNGHTTSCGCFHRERIKEVNTTHGQSHTPEYIALKARERLERKRELDTAWTIEMDQLLRQLQPSCVVCGSTEHLSVDHVHPLSKGHGLAPGNAVILCGSCNSTKFNKDLAVLPATWQTKIATAAAAFLTAWEEQ